MIIAALIQLAAMGLLHVPRAVMACARGYYRRKVTPSSVAAGTSDVIGISPQHPHTYDGRVGLFDVDGYAHMNNASYFVHAELARWQMSAENGSLDNMLNQRIAFIVTGQAIRYRREIGPLFKSFQINTFVSGIDDRNLWLYHTFHNPGTDGDNGGEQGPALAQILVQSVVTQNGKVMKPSKYLADVYGADESVIDRLAKMHEDELLMQKKFKFGELESILRESAGRPK